MKRILITLLPIIFLLFLIGCEEKSSYQGEVMGEFAPPDAYLEGSKHPYYGSENAWDRRMFTTVLKEEYKRRGQRQMIDLMEGKPQETEKYCRELIHDDPNDLESYFNLTIALAHLNKIDDAMDTLKVAIKKGLPFERFLAGPRDILKPLTQSKPFKSYASKYKVEILHGPMLGKVTDKSASFWVRTLNEVNVSARVSKNKNMKPYVESSLVKSKKTDDYTAIISVNNLTPDNKYYYEIFVDGKKESGLKIHSFRTYPVEGKPAKFQIVFGGCAGYAYWNERIWDTIKVYNPLAFLWMGDNVYINMPDYTKVLHHYTYYRRQSRSEFRGLVSTTSNYAIWDDHDAGTDDVWLGPYKEKPGWKMSLLENFKQNWINPFYGTDDWPGTYFNFTIGDVEFFMLDVRFYRTNPFEEKPTMLGPAQKAWLLGALKNSKAKFKVIASGVPWAFDAKADSKDTWNGFQEERKEIFDFLAESKINGVLLLSGDRHRTDIRKIDRENAYTLYDWENCRLTNTHVAPIEPGAIFAYNEKQLFGIIKFDTTLPDPTVTFEPMSIDNEKLYQHKLKLSQLSNMED
jgi:alkaline phosphatase D